jgi:hypothetical protein
MDGITGAQNQFMRVQAVAPDSPSERCCDRAPNSLSLSIIEIVGGLAEMDLQMH